MARRIPARRNEFRSKRLITVRQKRKDRIQLCFQNTLQLSDPAKRILNRGIDGDECFDVTVGGNDLVDLRTLSIQNAGEGVFFVSDGGGNA